VNAVNDEGMTALHHAALMNCVAGPDPRAAALNPAPYALRRLRRRASHSHMRFTYATYAQAHTCSSTCIQTRMRLQTRGK
jgi:hypothetical protein